MKSNNIVWHPSQYNTKVDSTVSEIKAMKICKEEDAIVVRGADIGENINICSRSGTQIKSIVTTNQVMKIKLPENQIYIINIGETRYIITM